MQSFSPQLAINVFLPSNFVERLETQYTHQWQQQEKGRCSSVVGSEKYVLPDHIANDN
jgi:hypothetical protein